MALRGLLCHGTNTHVEISGLILILTLRGGAEFLQVNNDKTTLVLNGNLHR